MKTFNLYPWRFGLHKKHSFSIVVLFFSVLANILSNGLTDMYIKYKHDELIKQGNLLEALN